MSVVEQEDKDRGPSLVVQLALLVVLTIAAVGMGWLAGGQLQGAAPQQEEEEEEQPGLIRADKSPQGDEEAAGEPEEAAPAVNIHGIDPITTNLAEPSETWVRMELALVFDGVFDPGLADTIHQDLFAYMRTVKLRQVESPSGFRHLKTDLEERARIRSEGLVTDVLIKMLIFE